MHLLTVIVGIVLLPKVYTLKCNECQPGVSGTCTNVQKDCASQNTQCSSMRITSYQGSSTVSELSVKSCALAQDCGEGSLKFGNIRTVITNKCCSTDLCNTEPAPAPIKTSPNGKKCYTCSRPECKTTLNCEGAEDYCFSGTMTAEGIKVTMKGCASKVFCSNTQSSSFTQAVQTEVSCCQGDYCNSACSTSAGLLLLLTPIYLVLFS
ncbi:urokinase plasminogen activator surface receptor-like [Mastacembelus armatus]|uniref:Urokinase plasminogen activator surface receptor-like n=1 Tax=Mastacembelus armatus TaxID=205130 RepID=A0A3Q3MG60_9TELE|nr:urokinase plasminogen activator surface receptor-like [Mastacembelus armatus]